MTDLLDELTAPAPTRSPGGTISRLLAEVDGETAAAIRAALDHRATSERVLASRLQSKGFPITHNMISEWRRR